MILAFHECTIEIATNTRMAAIEGKKLVVIPEFVATIDSQLALHFFEPKKAFKTKSRFKESLYN